MQYCGRSGWRSLTASASCCLSSGWRTLARSLLREALSGLAAGRIQPVPQESARATRYPLPDSEDFVVTPERPARWAYNFARGLYSREVPICIRVEGRRFRLLEPVDFDDAETVLDRTWQLDGQLLTLACTPGVFRARVAPLD